MLRDLFEIAVVGAGAAAEKLGEKAGFVDKPKPRCATNGHDYKWGRCRWCGCKDPYEEG